MVRENTRNGQLQRLSENLSLIRSMDPMELGFAPNTLMPDLNMMEQIRCYLRKMQNHYSPLKKLENLLKALSLAISRSINGISSANTVNATGDNLGTLSSVGSRTTCSGGGVDSATMSKSQISTLLMSCQNFGHYHHNVNGMNLERLPSLKNSNEGPANFSLIAKSLPGEGYFLILYTY